MGYLFLSESDKKHTSFLGFLRSIDDSLGEKSEQRTVTSREASNAYNELEGTVHEELAFGLVPFFSLSDREKIKKIKQSLQLGVDNNSSSSSKRPQGSSAKVVFFTMYKELIVKNMEGFTSSKVKRLLNTYNRISKRERPKVEENVGKIVNYIICNIRQKLKKIEEESEKNGKSEQNQRSKVFCDNEQFFLVNGLNNRAEGGEDSQFLQDNLSSTATSGGFSGVDAEVDGNMSILEHSNNVETKCEETIDRKSVHIQLPELIASLDCNIPNKLFSRLEDNKTESNNERVRIAELEMECSKEKSEEIFNKKLKTYKVNAATLYSILDKKNQENLEVCYKLTNAESDVRKLKKELEAVKDQLVNERNHAAKSIAKLTKNLKEEKEETENLEVQASQQRKDLDEKAEKIWFIQAQLDEKNRDFSFLQVEYNSIKQKFADQSKELKNAQVQISEKEKEISRLSGEILQSRESFELGGQKVYGLTEKFSLLTEGIGVGPGNENRKFSAVAPQDRKLGGYSYAFFVLSVVCAVGASLAIPYLVLCVMLAVAACAFSAVGCYCLCKANTALSNVEIDQQNNHSVAWITL